jgi:hypothetical protein
MAIRHLHPIVLAILLTGCSVLDGGTTKGQIYTDIIQPYSVDFRSSPVGGKHCVLDEHQLREPVSGYGVSVEWTADVIRAAADRAGISRISYIELQTTSYLLGIYRRQRLIIHGE